MTYRKFFSGTIAKERSRYGQLRSNFGCIWVTQRVELRLAERASHRYAIASKFAFCVTPILGVVYLHSRGGRIWHRQIHRVALG